jgi:chromosome segregation ATPase
VNPHGNPAPLAEARAHISADKRQRALDTITTLERDGHPVTHTTVARTAGVSTWLTYTDTIRQHIRAAQRRQAARPAPAGHARQEIKQLRQERDRAQTAVRHQLGRQLDAVATHDRTTRIDELTRHNHQLADQLQQATEENTALRARTSSLKPRSSPHQPVPDDPHREHRTVTGAPGESAGLYAAMSPTPVESDRPVHGRLCVAGPWSRRQG